MPAVGSAGGGRMDRNILSPNRWRAFIWAKRRRRRPDRADVLVLACTHYPLLAPTLRRILPGQMQIVDSAESTARVVRQMREKSGCHPERSEDASATERSRKRPERRRDTLFRRKPSFRASHLPLLRHRFGGQVQAPGHRFLGRQVDNVEHVDLGGLVALRCRLAHVPANLARWHASSFPTCAHRLTHHCCQRRRHAKS